VRNGDVPQMDIEFIPSTEVPTGLGERATTVVGPAIGTAIFAAGGAPSASCRFGRTQFCGL
jgi:isoquinoline 1-oxidoreductase subunit beta